MTTLEAKIRMKELLIDKGVQHTIISVIVLIGGGFLLAYHPEMRGEIFGAFGIMLGWWFGKQMNGNGRRY